MCYSTESSLTAWVISVAIGCYLWYRNGKYDRWNASFIWTFSAVQLWEAGIWSAMNTVQSTIFLKLIALTLVAQPLVQTFGAWKATGSKHDILKMMVGVYLVICLYTLYRVLTVQFNVNIGPNGHLVWNASDGGMVNGNIPLLGILYVGGLFLGLFYGLPNTAMLIGIGLATLVWSLSKLTTKEF